MSFFSFPNLKLAATTTSEKEPYPTFGAAAFTESYQPEEGWGQLVDPTAYPTFGAAALTESYETVEGWS